jgi:hypothetical protein
MSDVQLATVQERRHKKHVIFWVVFAIVLLAGGGWWRYETDPYTHVNRYYFTIKSNAGEQTYRNQQISIWDAHVIKSIFVCTFPLW